MLNCKYENVSVKMLKNKREREKKRETEREKQRETESEKKWSGRTCVENGLV